MALNNSPFVEYIQHWGSDLTTVNAARVSMGKRKNKFDEKDRNLIKYLTEHSHETPFRHSGATVCITCPIFIARQIHKHQIGVSINEISGRYVQFEMGDWWLPKGWRKQSTSVKQGSLSEFIEEPYHTDIDDAYTKLMTTCWDTYEMMVSIGVCKEQARAVLPQGMLTQFWMTGTLQAWAHFYKLRADNHAQQEIQEYAKEVGKILKEKFPCSWEGLVKKESK